MKINSLPVIVLDLDGVILKTNSIKHKAMLALFAEHSDKQTQIDAYLLARAGVTRREKMTGVFRDLLACEPTDELIGKYLHRYALALKDEVDRAPMLPGVENFIRTTNSPLYVCSSAPDKEVQQQLQRRGLLGCFVKVYGLSTPKTMALQCITQSHPERTIVFFGDSPGDLNAAIGAGVAFVAVAHERDHFASRWPVTLSSFELICDINSSIRDAQEVLDRSL